MPPLDAHEGRMKADRLGPTLRICDPEPFTEMHGGRDDGGAIREIPPSLPSLRRVVRPGRIASSSFRSRTAVTSAWGLLPIQYRQLVGQRRGRSLSPGDLLRLKLMRPTRNTNGDFKMSNLRTRPSGLAMPLAGGAVSFGLLASLPTLAVGRSTHKACDALVR